MSPIKIERVQDDSGRIRLTVWVKKPLYDKFHEVLRDKKYTYTGLMEEIMLYYFKKRGDT